MAALFPHSWFDGYMTFAICGYVLLAFPAVGRIVGMARGNFTPGPREMRVAHFFFLLIALCVAGMLVEMVRAFLN